MLLLLRLYRRAANPDPEWLRKLAHIGTGLIASSFPWIFSSRTSVFIVCSLSVALLLAMRYLLPLRQRMSGVLDGVERQSFGEFYFPISVATLYALSHGDKIFYVIPILVLTFADTVAALIGQEYGKHRYEASGSTKSWEGSVLFFTVTFLTVHIPLLLFTPVGRAESLFIALDIGLIVMMLEAIAWRGLDNVFIPLGVFALLRIYFEMSITLLATRLLVALGLMGFVFFYRRRTTLRGNALLAGALVLYASWALGGWRWLIAPAVLFLGYTLFYPGNPNEPERTHNVYAVASVSSSGLVWLLLARVWHTPNYLFPYTLAYANHLALLAWTLICIRPASRLPRLLPALCVVQAWLLMLLPYVAIELGSRRSLIQMALALPVCAFSFALFYWSQPRYERGYSLEGRRWYWQAAIAFVPTLIVSLL